MKPMNAFLRFTCVGRMFGLLALAGVFLSGLRAQVSDGPLGVPVKIWGASTARGNSDGEPGSLDISCNDFLESYPGANDGDFLVSGGAVAPNDFLTSRKVARLEVGKSYKLDIEGLYLASLGVNAVPPPGYDMEINGIVRTRFQLSQIGANYVTPMTIRVLPKGGGFMGRAGEATSLAGDRVRWDVALGGLTSGGSARALTLIDPGTSSDWSTIFTPASWSYESPSSEVYVYAVNNAPRQIFAPQAAVDVVTVTGTSFVVKFFHPSQVTGTTYPKGFSGDPYVTYQIEKGSTATSLKITSQTRNITSFTATNVSVVRTAVTTLERTGSWPTFGWSRKDWTTENATPLIEETHTGGGTTNDRTVGRSVQVPGQAAVTQTAEVLHLNAWGESTMGITGGGGDQHHDPVMTVFDYYTTATAPGSYTQVKSATTGSKNTTGDFLPSAQWEAYEYYDAAANDRHTGVLKYRYRPFNGTPATVTLDPAQGESTYFEYMADAFGMSTRASRIETKINGNTSALTTISYSDPVTVNGMLVITATRTDSTNATSSLVTTTRYYREDVADGFFRSQIHTIDQPSGVRQAMAYQRGTWSNGIFTLSANGGTAAGTASRIVTITGQKPVTDGTTSFEGYTMDNVQLVTGKSTKEVTFRDDRALIVRTETYAWMGSWVLVHFVTSGYDNAGQLTGRAENADGTYTGATYTATYDGEQKMSETDPSGVVVSYIYDSAGRVDTATRAGGGSIAALATTFEYDAESRVVKQTVGTAPAETLVSRWSYDSAGRIQTEMPAGLGQTYYGYDYDSTTQKWTRTKNAPDNGTTIWTYCPGGQLEKVEGSAVVSRYFTYGVLGSNDGRRTVEVHEGEAGSPRWRKTWLDWLGRVEHTERAGVTGQATITETYSYDSGGRLGQLGRTGYASRFYEYDELSQLKRTGLGVSNPAGPLNEQSDDRITDYDQRFESWNGAYWLRHEATVRPVSGSAAAFTSFSRDRLTGFAGTLQGETRSQDLEGNTTTTTTDVDRSAKTVTVQTSRSGVGGYETRMLTNGFLTGAIDHAGLSTVLIYDALGRLSTTTDSRNNTATTHYLANTPLVDYVEDAAHHAVSTFNYYNTGAVRWRRDAAGQYVYFSYNYRGQLERQWGGGAYPIEYGYDTKYGDRVTQKTFRGGTDWGLATWPTNPGTADWTRWTYDEPTGLVTEKYDAANLDASGALIANPKKVAYTYNSRGQIETRTLARGPKTTYGYDSNTGELLTQTYQNEQAGVVTPPVTYTYTRTGQLDTVVDLTGTRDFVYDSAKPWRLSAEKYSIDNHYFGAARVMSTLYQETVNTDVVGRYRGFQMGAAVGSSSDLEQTLGFTAAGRIDTVAGKRSANAVSRTFKYDYRTDAALVSALSVVGESGFGVSYDYEAERDLLKTINSTWTDSTSHTESRTCYDYVYNALGQRYTAKQSGTAFGDFTAATYYRYVYNERGELTSAADYLGNTPTTLTGTPDENAQLPSRNFAYVYDNQGNRLSSSRNGIAGLDIYQPNSLNQYDSRTNNYARAAGTVASGTTVISATGGGLGWVAANKGGYWAADAQVPANSAAASAPLSLQAVTPDGANPGALVKTDNTRTVVVPAQAQSFHYDFDGNLTDDGVWSYVYDAENRLIRMTSLLGTGFTHLKLEFAYDYLGRRVEKKVTNNDTQAPVSQRRYLYDGWNLVAELTGDGSGLTRSYTWGLDVGGGLTSSSGPGGLLQITDHISGNRYLPAYDGNGNVAALLNASSGAVAIAYEYSPFGELLRAGAATATSGVDSVIADNPFRFATKFADVETGLVYYGHRFYSPTLGRFINRDPIEEAGGVNLYGFCGNDSVNGSDFLGMQEGGGGGGEPPFVPGPPTGPDDIPPGRPPGSYLNKGGGPDGLRQTDIGANLKMTVETPFNPRIVLFKDGVPVYSPIAVIVATVIVRLHEEDIRSYQEGTLWVPTTNGAAYQAAKAYLDALSRLALAGKIGALEGEAKAQTMFNDPLYGLELWHQKRELEGANWPYDLALNLVMLGAGFAEGGVAAAEGRFGAGLLADAGEASARTIDNPIFLRIKHEGLLRDLLENPQGLVRPPGSMSADLIAELTSASEKEIALLRVNGQRILRMGDADSVMVDDAERVIAHSHRSNDLRLSDYVVNGQRVGDVPTMQVFQPRQVTTVIVGQDGSTARLLIPRPPPPPAPAPAP